METLYELIEKELTNRLEKAYSETTPKEDIQMMARDAIGRYAIVLVNDIEKYLYK